MPEVKIKLPKTLAGCADRLYEARQERLEVNKDVEAFKAEEQAIKDYLIETLPKGDAGGIQGKVARVSIVTKQVPQVEDWDALYTFIKKTGYFQLLNRALNVASAMEMLENSKKPIPGVKMFGAVTVSVNKV